MAILEPKIRTGRNSARIGKVKLEDVALTAEVSPATVSRVLNHPDIVRPEVRARVLRAIAEMGYTRDSAARALVSRTTRTVGAVVPTLTASVFGQGVEAMQSRLSEHGYTLLIASSQYDSAKELQEIENLIERGVDGMVLVGDIHLPKVYQYLKRHGVPFLTTYVCKTRSGVTAIGIDNETASYDMTRYLLGLGHREFGVIANMHVLNDRSSARVEGIQRGLREAGIRLPKSQLIKADHSLTQGRNGLRQLMTTAPSITAVLCTTDTIAIGAMAEARALGLNVPQRLSITGFDDADMSSQLEPSLTTISTAASEIGRAAADCMVNAIQGIPAPGVVQLPYRLIVRRSTGKAFSRLAAT